MTGHGTVDGRPVAVFAHDQTVFGGAAGEMFGRKVAAVNDFALKVGCPVVGINDSGGARIQDAVSSLAWYANMGSRQEPLSGVCPQISVILGKCAGGAVYAPINTDVVVATERVVHVRHRTRRHQVGHRRRGQPRGSGRSAQAGGVRKHPITSLPTRRLHSTGCVST